MKTLEAKRYDVLEVRGSPYDRGFKYGVYNREKLKKHVESHKDFYAKYTTTTWDGATREAAKFIQPTKDYSEIVWNELRGTADGSGVPLAELMVITLFDPRPGAGCTAFAVRDGATIDGLTYVGQNNDEAIDPWMSGDCTTLTRYVQSDAPNALIYTYAGIPAMMGINSAGLCVLLNALVSKESRIGVPNLVVVREVMNQGSLDGALHEIERSNMSSAQNFVIGSPEGIMDVEYYPDGIKTYRPKDMLWHTNHCLYSEGKRYEDDDFRSNSVTRCSRIEALLRAGKGRLDLKTLQGFLSDHEGMPDSVCWHPNPAKPREKRLKTLDSMIYLPESREAWIAKGNPCETAFVMYSA